MTRHLLIIGAQRCGTTWLVEQLDQHPQVTTARPSRPEPKVFCSEELCAHGRDWYVDTWFGHATDETLLLEKSTSYLEFPEAADRAAAMLGDPLIVVQLRDPVRRAMSHWAFSTDSGMEDRPLEDVLAANLQGPLPWDAERTSVSPYAYLERGRYVDYLRPWLDRFGDDVSIVLLEEMLADPSALDALHRRLGLTPTERPAAADSPLNASSSPTPDLDPSLHQQLRDYYATSDQELARLLGRPLPWRPETAPEG